MDLASFVAALIPIFFTYLVVEIRSLRSEVVKLKVQVARIEALLNDKNKASETK